MSTRLMTLPVQYGEDANCELKRFLAKTSGAAEHGFLVVVKEARKVALAQA